MVKTLKKVLAIALALCVVLLPLQAFADGMTTTTETTTTTTTDENGNTTVTVTINKTTTGTTEDGVTVNREETRSDSTITDADGFVLGTSWEEDGYEKKEWTEEDNGDEAGQPEVEVELIPGSTKTGTASSTTTEGNTTTTTTYRTVTAQTSEITSSATATDVNMESIRPEDYEGKYSETGNHLFNSYKDGSLDSYKVTGEAPEGGEYQYITGSDHGVFWLSQIKVIYKKDAEGNPVTDENGKYIIERLEKKDGTVMLDPETLEPSTDLNQLWKYYNTKTQKYEFAKTGTRPTMFMLKNENGQDAYAYCVDLITGAKAGKWYSVANLEDGTYYASEDAADHIRSIATHGYWGTDIAPDEDGNYKTGSVSKIKQDMKKAIENGDIPDEYTYTYYPLGENETGDVNTGSKAVTVTVKLSEVLDGLTAGEALVATQAAIWSYANGSIYAMSGEDGMVMANTIYGQLGRANDYTPENAARVDALYKWLINLETEEKSTVVINDKNFVKDLSLTVGDKVADHQDNKDDNKDNDVYNADLNFKLAFVPGAKDDLLLRITYNDLDGNPVTVVRRLAGKNSEDQTYIDILPEEDGSYILKDLKLSENTDFGFDLKLEGTQYLEHGVYIYSPVGGREKTQSMVGLAEGSKSVAVNMGVTISFEVDETDTIVAESKWHDEHDPNYNPPEEEEPPRENKVYFRKTHPKIDEPEVPLAKVPKTGDFSIILIIAIAVTALGLAALCIFSKKHTEKHEE